MSLIYRDKREIVVLVGHRTEAWQVSVEYQVRERFDKMLEMNGMMVTYANMLSATELCTSSRQSGEFYTMLPHDKIMKKKFYRIV